MSSVPKLRFPEFEGEWERGFISEVSDINPGNDGLPEQFQYIDLEIVVSGNLTKTNIIKRQNAPSRAQRLLAPDDILFQAVRPYQQNNYLFKGNTKPVVASTGYIQMRVSEPPLFMYQLIHTNRFLQQVLVRCTGTSYPAINSNDFATIRINYPGKNEQTKIADFLSLIDKKITKQDEKVAALEQYKKGLMQRIFSRESRFKDNNGKDYPEWEAKPLNDMVSFARGFGLSKSSIAANGFKECILYGELFTEYSATINKVKSKTNSTSGLISQTNDVLMPTSDVTPRGLCKASCLLKDGVLLGGDINILRPKFNFSGTFISYIINALHIKILEKVTGTTVKHIYTKDIKNIIYSVPCLLEQTKIANFLSLYDRKIEKEKAKLEALKVQKKGLLQQMFV